MNMLCCPSRGESEQESRTLLRQEVFVTEDDMCKRKEELRKREQAKGNQEECSSKGSHQSFSCTYDSADIQSQLSTKRRKNLVFCNTGVDGTFSRAAAETTSKVVESGRRLL